MKLIRFVKEDGRRIFFNLEDLYRIKEFEDKSIMIEFDHGKSWHVVKDIDIDFFVKKLDLEIIETSS